MAVAGLAPLALCLAGRAGAAEAHCGGDLPMSQKNRRSALGYVEASTDPQRRCGHCTFFTGGDSGCGACQMLSGAQVSAQGVCNSFVVRQD